MQIELPEFCLVLLVGPSGSGKSTFAAQHFAATEVISSDWCRGMVADDPNSLPATKDAFDLVHYIAAKRLAAGRLAVIDATNLQPDARAPLLQLARDYHCLTAAIVFAIPEAVCAERNRLRPDRTLPAHALRRQVRLMRRVAQDLSREGVRYVSTLNTPDEAAQATIERQPLWTRRLDDAGPFDIIGDVHGCFDELTALLERLGYRVASAPESDSFVVTPPAGRRAVFLGDLVDRGPQIAAVLRLVMGMVQAGTAICVPGNHDIKALRALRGRPVTVTHGLAETLQQLEAETPDFRREVAKFLDSLVSHFVFDDGRLIVAHAGMKESMQGRASRAVRDFALFGETTGETDEFGLPVRYNWAAEYRGQALVVYGHTPVAEPVWLNDTINIDTGCVFGGALTALRYPERELVSVPSQRAYYEPIRPVRAAGQAAGDAAADADLVLGDVLDRRVINTRLRPAMTVSAGQAAAALEVMSRFAVDPRWLIYLPPTMSPPRTSDRPDLLEHPTQAFDFYRREGVPRVVCEEKHMGSRAVFIIARDEQVSIRRFGIASPGAGMCYTRTGRRFFDDPAIEEAVLSRLRSAMDGAGLWEELGSDWVCLDAEILPWSAKAGDLLRRQYAATGAAARTALADTVASLSGAGDSLRSRFQDRAAMVDSYIAAYRRHCWPVRCADDLRVAPFHLLAGEGRVYADRDHVWHLETIGRVCEHGGPMLLTTPHRIVDLADPSSVAEATAWWEALTAGGGEGMVVKPLDFVPRGRRGLTQPALKCRGREYLRLIYGPEYTAPEHLECLRTRALGRKRSLVLREFALGLESLERFVRREPLYRVHECVFGVLALESEPVDPRL